MPLNLGFVNRDDVSTSMSLDDMYVAWLETDQEFVNLMNAEEIAARAKDTQSTECISFAEELLGASCEAVLSGSAARIGRNAISNFKTAYRSAAAMRQKLMNMDTEYNLNKVAIATHILNISNQEGLEKPIRSGTVHVTISKAISEMCEALLQVMNLLGNQGFAVANDGAKKAKQFAGYLKDDAKRSNGRSVKDVVVDRYAKTRKGVAFVLREARKLIRTLENQK